MTLTVTAPSGAEVHRVERQVEAKFSLVAGETGRHRFCLEASGPRRTSRYAPLVSVIWDLQTGHIETESAIENDANNLRTHGEQLLSVGLVQTTPMHYILLAYLTGWRTA